MTKTVSDTVIPVADGKALMALFIAHIRDEHEIELEETGDGTRFFEQEGFRLDLRSDPRGLYVRIEGPNANDLVFLKEEIAGHVAEIDATAAGNIRWSGETAQEGALPANFKVLQVVSTSEVFPGLYRVTLSHDDVSSLAAGGVHLRLMMPLDRSRTPVWPRMAANGAPVWPQDENRLHARFVTLRSVRPAHGEVDIDIVCHRGGLISDWAQKANKGQTVGVMGPAGNTVIPADATRICLAADGTGLASVARLMETLPDGVEGDVVVAFASAGDARDYLPEGPLRLHAIEPARFDAEIGAAVRDLTRDTSIHYAYFAGEFENAQDLRRYYKTHLGLDKTRQISTAYWRRGVPGYGS
ncbi:MAG: siderophore-interacting protein [Pseudomonadota bacterium]